MRPGPLTAAYWLGVIAGSLIGFLASCGIMLLLWVYWVWVMG